MLSRREWLMLTGGAFLSSAFPSQWASAQQQAEERVIPDYEKPMFNIPGQIKDPVIIQSIELLKRGNNYFVRTTSKDGAVGLSPTKQIAEFLPMFQRLAPFFRNKDARDIETLLDGAYISDYKNAGLALNCPMAYIEQGLLDMLGKIAKKPIGAMLGGVIRKEVAVYLSGSDRVLTAEEEVAVYERGVPETGAQAVKFKIGGRMSRNLDAYPGRTETLIKLSRQKLGDRIVLYSDANGSYNAKKAIEIGKHLEAANYSFYEEPCPFEELSETIEVAKALKIPIAAGEQDGSLWRFKWMMENGMMKIVQPDINYNGGLIRALRVAKMAEKLGLTIVPHNTQTGVASVNILQFSSCVKNPGPHMEYPWRQSQQTESWYSPNFTIKGGKIQIPTGPGLGIEIDPEYIKTAEVVVKVG